MPQLDFREALSTPEEKLFVAPASAPVAPVARPNDSMRYTFFGGLGLTRSAWANIVFVALASVGGLICAFYFFNGGELLRAAAAWPSEFLYSRPLSTDKIDVGVRPNPRRTASLTPKLSITPPSRNSRSSRATGGSTVGIADEARTASATGPWSK